MSADIPFTKTQLRRWCRRCKTWCFVKGGKMTGGGKGGVRQFVCARWA